MAQSGDIKHIVFDLSEVLLTGIKDTGIALAEKHQLEHSEIDEKGVIGRTPLLVPLIEEFFHGNISEDEYVQDVVAKYPQIGSAEWLKSHIRENFREVEGTRDVVVGLREAGYSLALLSIHAKEWIEYCEEKFNFHDLFDVRVYSHETGVSKPDPEAFREVLRQLDAKAQECVFIDDFPVNVDAAMALGFHGVVFRTADVLRRDLSALLPGFA